MIRLVGMLFACCLFVVSMTLILKMWQYSANADKCENSRHKTREFKIINNVLYCKASNNSIQKPGRIK